MSVANLMSEIGLTHGGFYTHFKSKEALMSEAMEAAFGETMNAWHKVLASTKKRIGFTNLVDLYWARSTSRIPRRVVPCRRLEAKSRVQALWYRKASRKELTK